MIAEAIEKIEGMAQAQILSNNGRAYSDKELFDLESPASQPTPFKLHTLSGLVDYIKSNVDMDGRSQRLIIVDGPKGVRLCSDLYGDFEQRDTLVTAEPFLPEGFPVGRYVDVETFMIKLQSCFVQDETTKLILQLVGNMEASTVGTVADDGVSQTVATRKGVTKLENVKMPSPIMLRPFRTFQELEQPTSRFVLRLRGDGTKLPEVALFEGDDNHWQLEAINSIRAFLVDNKAVGIPVFA